MGMLDPNNPEELEEILGYLIEEEMEKMTREEIWTLLQKHNTMDKSFSALTKIGSSSELEFILTYFHFTQQVIFDYYEFTES